LTKAPQAKDHFSYFSFQLSVFSFYSGMRIFEMARELAVIQSAAHTLSWDQETYMPPAAARHRADQMAWLSTKAHELATSEEWQRALEEAENADDGTDFKTSANLREMRRQFERKRRLPTELVRRESEAVSIAKHAWASARQKDDFAAFAPHLDTLIGIAREQADCWGYDDEPYDALLEAYERRTRTRLVAELFDSVSDELREIAAAAVEKSAMSAVQLPDGPYPVARQQDLNARIAESIGIDFEAARIDTTAHPFCTNLGPGDQRLTTRYDEGDFTSSLFGILHEAGHGLYEMGLPQEDYGLPSGSSLSLGIHESQSRLWENHIGRSRVFWEKWYPTAQETFPQLASFDLDDFMRHLQRAAYSPIRVEADEATYDLHILLRFGIERRLLNGELDAAGVPAAWNEAFEASFGFAPSSNREGCLQDIHWSMGGIGYFPTYSLGNFNAAQLHDAARREPEIAATCDKADYGPLLQWLRRQIHERGALIDPADMMQEATGEAPNSASYLRQLRTRYL